MISNLRRCHAAVTNVLLAGTFLDVNGHYLFNLYRARTKSMIA